ncbi:MAG: O-acetylhomoserine (thiol)-lyase, partial [Sulfitobacter sp.]
QFSPNSTALRTSFQKIVLIRANTAALWTTTPPPVWCAQIPTGDTTMTDTKLAFETLQIHAGAVPDPATGARQTPIYQTTAYVFRDADHAAALFNLQEVGYIYSRLTNPTVAVLQERIATLEGGAGAVCCSSGHAAQIMALFPLMGPGKNVVVSTRLYGGTITQFSQTIKRFGWSATFVDFDDLAAVKAAIDDNTRAIFCESIANPGGYITDLRAIADVSDAAGIPLIVDNTTATPYLCNPIEHGATLVVHSTTKYLTGNGTVTGGCVVDSGKFDWMASDKFPSLSQPEPAYHGLVFAEVLGPMAFTFHSIAIGLRDLGMTMNPQGAHYTLMGIETLSLRMERHVENAMKIAAWLETHDAVEAVTYAGLPSSPYQHRVASVCPKGAGALFTIALKGGYASCIKFVDSLELFSHVANLGDTRSLVIHSASTTHRQLNEEQQVAAGAAPNVVRLSIGIEDAGDLMGDLDQALKASA